MKLSSILFFCVTLSHGSRCLRQLLEDHRSKMKQCQSKALMQATHDRNVVRGYRKEFETFTRQKEMLESRFCKRAKELYEPNGLIDEVPTVWGCERDEQIAALAQKIKHEAISPPDKSANRPFNIVLTGPTGAGKSYFGNGLLGVKNPGRTGDDVPFGSSASASSVTKEVTQRSGYLFGGHYDQVLGLKASLPINVYDTPGFVDTNITDMALNRLLIASSIKDDIDMVIFLMPTTRLDASLQASLAMVNEWTGGHVWPNLLMVRGRLLFDEGTVQARNQNKISVLSSSTKDRYASLLYQRSVTNRRKNPQSTAWKLKTLNSNKVKYTPLSKADFQQLEVSSLNMAQHQACLSKADRAVKNNGHSKCWKMPILNEFNDYDQTKGFTDDYVFIEEAKKLANLLVKMRKRPLPSADKLVRAELEADVVTWNEMVKRSAAMQEKYRIKAVDNKNDPFAKCAEIPMADSCPRWASWGEWSSCPACGPAYKSRTRQGCFVGNKSVLLTDCENDMDRHATDKAICEAQKPCETGNSELMSQMIQMQNQNQQNMMNLVTAISQQSPQKEDSGSGNWFTDLFSTGVVSAIGSAAGALAPMAIAAMAAG